MLLLFMKKQVHKFLILFIICSNTICSELPIIIKSNSAFFNDKNGTAIYSGKVISSQGNRHLTAEKLIIKKNNNTNKINLITATGNLAKFDTIDENNSKISGEGKTILYYPEEEKLILKNNAKLQQDKDIITGNFLTYLLEKNQIKSDKSSRRTTLILHPKLQQSK